MQRHHRIIRVRFSGYGHYKVTISYYGKPYTATIDCMPLIDNYKDDNPIVSEMNDLYDRVKRLAVPTN